jgi:flagellar biogenesis protein FliO
MHVLIAQATTAVAGLGQPGATGAGWSDGPGVVRTLLSLLVVLGLMGGGLWLLRRGGWPGGLRRGPRPVQIETAVGLGDRRQLVIVAVEGRRLLLGVTQMHVALVTELAAAVPGFPQALDARLKVAAASDVAPPSTDEGR